MLQGHWEHPEQVWPVPKYYIFSISLAITEKARHVFTYQTLLNPLGKFCTNKIPGLCSISIKIKEFIFFFYF